MRSGVVGFGLDRFEDCEGLSCIAWLGPGPVDNGQGLSDFVFLVSGLVKSAHAQLVEDDLGVVGIGCSI